MRKSQTTLFVTGFPGFIAKRLVTRLASEQRQARIVLLVLPTSAEDARRRVEDLPNPDRVRVLEGDVAGMHLGLSGAEYAELCDQVTDVWHLAALSSAGVAREEAQRVNVEGTRNVLELARDARHVRRVCHFSSAFVSGDREGVVLEDELDLGQGFRTAYEETKFQAEKLVQRAARDLPVIVFRPGIVVGDSRTGEVERLDGPYFLSLLMVAGPMAMPLPGGGAPLHAVPVDFLVDAVVRLSADPRALGKTFHLVDPCPVSARRVYEQIAALLHKKTPQVAVSAKAADALLRLPWIERLVRPQRAALGYLNHLVFYNCQNTLELLEGSGLRCPPIGSYLPRLLEFVRASEKQREERTLGEDPLDR